MKLKNTDLFLEAVADYDENLLRNSWKMKTLLQRKKSTIKSCYGYGYHSYDCWFFFKNKGVQSKACLNKDSIEGIHPDDADLLEEDQTKIMRKPDVKEPFAVLAFKSY
jgi:elongation factor G